MKEDFLKKLREANQKAVDVYTKSYHDKLLEEYNANKKYADMYQDLILAFVEVYDYEKDEFNINGIKKDLTPIIGSPRKIVADVDPVQRVGFIQLYYNIDKNSKPAGLPRFINEEKPDFGMICTILKENDIDITRNHEYYGITFDASVIINTRGALAGKTLEIRKKILQNN